MACDQHHRSQSGHSRISDEALPLRSSFNGSGLVRAVTVGSPQAMPASRRRSIGLLAQAGGVAVLAVGMHTANLALFLIGGVVANMGAGVLFKSAVGAVAAMAGPATRIRAPLGIRMSGTATGTSGPTQTSPTSVHVLNSGANT
jgi:hypothetical protein